jgi:outer membrane protein assembly factor BamB
MIRNASLIPAMKLHRYFWILLFTLIARHSASADDWPTFRHDAARTGYTSENLADDLTLQWTFRSQKPTRPAWPRSQRMTFDQAMQPIIAEGRVFFGSSVDGRIYALDATSGQQTWTFPTRAPIRFAPAWHKGKLYAVSDDGFLYCLNAANGKLLWKKRGGPGDEMSLGNGRMISRWAARGGAVVHDGIVYFAAGIWPSDGVSLHALDPDTGKTLWVNDTAGSIYMGQPHGGAFAKSGVASQGYLAASDSQLFMATGRGVPAAFDRKTGAFQYLHLQSNTKLGGSDITLSDKFFINSGYAFDQKAGATGQRIGAGPMVATPGGVVCSINKTLLQFEWRDTKKVDRKGKPQSIRSLVKSFTSIHRADAVSSIVANDKHIVGHDGQVTITKLGQTNELWRASVSGVAHGLAAANQRLFVSTDAGEIHCFGAGAKTPRILESNLDATPYEASVDIVKAAEEIIRKSGVTEGYALDLGCDDGSLAFELAMRTKLFIYAIDPDPANVATARKKLTAAGLYGSRVMVLQADLEDTNLPRYFANLIVSARSLQSPLSSVSLAEANRSLRPYGGVIALGKSGKIKATIRGPLEGAGEWTHQYANPGNTVNSADELISGPLGMLWFADLEQPMTQRHGRGPAPLFKNGVLFSEGLDGIIAVDAYNGHKLWEHRLPDILKSFHGDHLMGTSGTGSNYCVTDDSVYVRLGNRCLRIDARTGKLIATFTAPKTADGKDGVWGYISSEDGFLFGSLSNPEHVVTYRFRPGGDMKDQLTESRTFFALDAKTGELKWRYDAEHSLRHNGIAIAGGVAVLIDRPLATVDLRRAAKAADEAHPTGALVALNAGTGEVLWRNTKDIYGTVSAISSKHHTLMMSYQPTRFRLASEIGGRISAFNLSDGELLWEKESKYDSRPVINDRTIYAQGGAWDLITGEDRPFNFKRSYGCGVLAGSRDMMIFRSATLGYFDLTKNEETEDFGGIRPGCWINAIPAGGLVFAPDASAGCKCSYLNQSWIALQPDGTRAPSITPDSAASPKPISVALKSDLPARESIRYTLDGSAPTKDSPLYRQPIAIVNSGKLRARAFTAKGRPSPVAEADFVIDQNLLPLNKNLWRVEDAPGAKPPSAWSIEGGTIEQTSNVMVGGKRVMEDDPAVERPGSLFLFKDANLFSTGELSFEMNSADDDGVGVALRYQGPDNYYLWNTHSQRPFRALAVKQGKRYEVLASNKRGFERRKWLQIKIVFTGSKITGFINGEKDFEIDDSTYSEGTIGFYSWGNSGVQFRNVKFERK